MPGPLARESARWTRQAVQPAARNWLGSQVVKIESFGTYACRPVNGMAGGQLSEHGRANAVDISAFALRDGRRITVLAGWTSEGDHVRTLLRPLPPARSRRFGLPLGPEANSPHQHNIDFHKGMLY